MLIVLDIFLFVSLAMLLVSLIMQNNSNKESVLKAQAYSCIAALSFEVVSLVIRFLLARYWLPVLLVLIINAIISIGIFMDANDYGVFEKKNKKKHSQTNVTDVVV